MARNSSKQIMGYLKIDEKHHAAITSLVAPATPAHRLLDTITIARPMTGTPFNGQSIFSFQHSIPPE